MQLFYDRLRDDEWIDEIQLKVVPRFKTSDLSGDEWRISVHATALRKGIVVGSRSWGRMDAALARLQPWIADELLCPIDNPRLTDDLCMQPGCDQQWTVEYRIVEEGCGSCGHVKPLDKEYFDYRRRFCARHAKRGDQSLHDSDRNYAPVDGGQPPAEQMVRPEDESPAAFAGVIALDLPPVSDSTNEDGS